MACFVAPVAEAVVTTIAERVMKSKEKEEVAKASLEEGIVEDASKIKFSTKLGWLNKLLWGGSALLAFEHVWHGEVVPYFPFLTAVKTGETAEMLGEIGSTGVMMAVLVTVVWACMLGVSAGMEKRTTHTTEMTRENI